MLVRSAILSNRLTDKTQNYENTIKISRAYCPHHAIHIMSDFKTGSVKIGFKNGDYEQHCQ